MKINRIYAIMKRIFYGFIHTYDRLTDVFYYPVIDLLLWGLTSSYFSLTSNNHSSLMMIVAGILLWIIVWRGQYEISVGLLEDIWDKNLINIFASPLKFSEWIIAFIIIGIFKAAVSSGFAALMAYLLYRTSIFVLGWYFIPLAFLLIMSGWWIGFFIAGILLRYGSRVQTLAWALVYLISPFSAIYYPVSILPIWAQKIARVIPISYVFENARSVIKTGRLNPSELLVALVLNIIYLILAGIFLRKSFNKILDKGLVKVF